MVQSTSRTDRQLFKILVAAAWIDGEMQTAEQAYLHKIARARGLFQDQEIQSLLATETAIDSAQCYQWLREYLGSKPTVEIYQNLLAEIAGLVYADGDIAEAEAKLLTQLQSLDPSIPHSASMFKPLLRLVRQLYRKHINHS